MRLCATCWLGGVPFRFLSVQGRIASCYVVLSAAVVGSLFAELGTCVVILGDHFSRSSELVCWIDIHDVACYTRLKRGTLVKK
ncbi:uncharacterized protein BO80DRAFT_209476 [Aspergillus ibericus CBS 121593]|uniref:Uncharacterized protein n=1 Tax=Aspergillus ibericus CBS 121593 TaxID=1448316 RepID=A0A395HAY9_9EURO|nr:hypothetical protein BO80DRAFT_209476 [Aspergillus ibericus CBS 121593]RAL04816.1 hypothetical protein BO80DRAFT_209476 [Aspergillus ibericus CBS 121593]